MAAGLQNNTIAFIIQARMQSARLPGKILMPIPIWKGKPLLSWIVMELKKSNYKADIIVATSKNKENDVLENFCKKQGIECFRGNEENVLSRFTGIVKDNSYSTVVRLTADNPIIDIDLLDRTISQHLKNKSDYTKTEGLPTGMNFEVMSGSALVDTEKNILTKSDKEHVTLFLRNNNKYRKHTYNPVTNTSLKDLRLTVDYPSDLLVISTLLSFYQEHKTLGGLKLVEKVFTDFPMIFEANRSNCQKKQFSNTGEELKHAITLLKDLELNNAALILSSYEKENSI